MSTGSGAAPETPSVPWIGTRIWRFLNGPPTAMRPPKQENALRIGVVGAAKIAPSALIHPASLMADVVVAGITARDKARAVAFAEKHGIAKVYDTYADMLADPSIEAVYVPSPNGLHYMHTVQALRAGKHVLCEKPLASNEREAAAMAQEAETSGRVLFEAFHYRYHPATLRAKHIVTEELGPLKRIHVHFPIPSVAFGRDDIRFSWDLAGGALMDAGCYSVNMLRFMVGKEPAEVALAECVVHPSTPKIDDTTRATLKFPDSDITASVECSLVSSITDPLASLTIEGENGTLEMYNWVLPALYHKITVKLNGQPTRTEKVYGDGNTTYVYQLRAFVDAVRKGTPFPTTAADGIANMHVIDAIYTKANMPLREGKPLP